MKALRIAILLFLCVTNSFGQKDSSPNVIIIYTDDMGVGDAQFSGGQMVNTPNLNQLAKEGKVFTQYYTTAPVCSPSRTSLTTGMYHIKWGINTFLNNKKFNARCEQLDYLSPKAPSIAKVFKANGYATAHIGKWHMGGGRDVFDAPSIEKYGFDEFCSTYESPNPDPLLTSTNWIWADSDSIKRWERTAYFVDKTLEFVKKRNGEKFFVNLWPDDVHTPWVTNEQDDKPSFITLPNLKPVMEAFDFQIGRLMKGLKELELDQNTIVIFTSDNGPAPDFDLLRTNGLRGVKNSLYEGGVLMPFIVRWPAQIMPNQIDTKSIIASIDILPTLCKLAQLEIPMQIDGEDVSKVFIGKKAYKRENDLFFEYGRNDSYRYPDEDYQRSPQLAMRRGDWKLFTNAKGQQTELYNLKSDKIESTNLANKYPRMVQEMKQKLINWYEQNDKLMIKD